tara:strand:+ start:690 stop:902 length:213 start_codon:yes stop_codon:yes gene_type:complete
MNIDDNIILKNLIINTVLNSNKFLFLKKMNKINELNHDDIEVAIGIIIKPMLSKKYILKNMLRKTETSEI